MQPKVLFFVNPISGTREKKKLPELIAREAASHGFAYEIIPTREDGRYEYLKDKISSENISRIGICGGDGSVNQVVHVLGHLQVDFGIIPFGSGNGLAFAAGIPKNTEKALAIFFTGTPKRVDAFEVNGQFACMLCGLGLDAQVAHEFAVQKKRGLGTYASLTTKAFFTSKPFNFQVTANGITFTSEAFFISIANSNQFGNNFTIAPEALLSDGQLDIVIVKKMARPALLVTLIRQLLSGRSSRIETSLHAPIIYFQTGQITIKNMQNAPLHIDGEPRQSMPELNIRIQPSYFSLIHGI